VLPYLWRNLLRNSHSPSLSDIASILFKNHFEMRQRHGDLLQGSPFPFNIALDFGTAGTSCAPGSLKLGVEGNQLVITAQDKERSFSLATALPGAHDSTNALYTVKLKTPTGELAKQVSASDLAGLSVPADFVALHEKVVHHLKSLFPASFASSTAAPGAATAPASDKPSAAAAEPSPEAASPEQPNSEFTTYVVKRHNLPNLRFEGKLLAQVSGLPVRGRGFEFSVYETPTKKLVAIKVGYSHWLNEQDTVLTHVAQSKDELVEFFGFAHPAKKLYQQLAMVTDEVVG
jgi:hypothetical protein